MDEHFSGFEFFLLPSLVHDRQVAEDDEEQFFGIIRLAYDKSDTFIRMAYPTFRNAVPPQPPRNGRLYFFI